MIFQINFRIRYGYCKIRVLLIREGWQVGKKLVMDSTARKGWICTDGASREGRCRSIAGRNRGRSDRIRCEGWTSYPISSLTADDSGR